MKRFTIFTLLLPLVAAGCENVSSGNRTAADRQPSSKNPAGPGYPTDWVKQKWVDEFSLLERSGQTFHSEDMAGKVWVVSVFFTACPTECLRQNEAIKALHTELAPRGVTFVSITCDPETDTPKRLRDYANRFTTDAEGWLFLTGEEEHLRRVTAERFRLAAGRFALMPNTDPTLEHAPDLVVIDKWGNQRDKFNWKSESEIVKLKKLVTELLEETAPPDDFKQKNGVRLIEQQS